MKNLTILPSLANKFFISFREESDEPICTYNDEKLRYFVRQSIKRGRCSSLNQHYNSTISNEVFNFISRELDINGKICEISNKIFEYTINRRKKKKTIMIYILKTIEISSNIKKQNMSTISLVKYQYMTTYKN